jgi:hypothetical protein
MLHLDGGAVSDSLVGVDALVELLAVKVLGEEFLDLGDTRGASDKHNLMKTFRIQPPKKEKPCSSVRTCSQRSHRVGMGVNPRAISPDQPGRGRGQSL